MMKTLFSLLMIFSFLCLSAQEKDTDGDGVLDKDDACPDVVGPVENNGCPWPDTDGDGILDKDDKCPTVVGIPEKNGCPGKDCKKLYEAEKINYEQGLKRINEVNFDKLFDIIINDEEFKNSFFNKKKIVFINFPRGYGPECGNDPYYDCPHFEKHLYDEITKKIWNKTNFDKLRKKIENSFIIPTVTDGKNFGFGEQDEKNNFFSLHKISSFYEGKMTDEYGKTKKFYYYSSQKPKKELQIKKQRNEIIDVQYITFTLAVIENGQFSTNNKEEQYIYITQIRFYDEKNNHKSSIPKSYQYKDGKWKFIEEYK